MTTFDDIRASKFMSLVLRHAPAEIGITPDSSGWVDVDVLVSTSDGLLSDETVRRIVEASEKQRFGMSADGLKVRANQGHSIKVDIGLAPVTPPERLFHGTAKQNLDVILSDGLRPMSRQHVHLSQDQSTAHKVGMRHGKPVVLNVQSHAMHAAGHLFYLSENGVWLTDTVPSRFLRLAE